MFGLIGPMPLIKFNYQTGHYIGPSVWTAPLSVGLPSQTHTARAQLLNAGPLAMAGHPSWGALVAP